MVFKSEENDNITQILYLLILTFIYYWAIAHLKRDNRVKSTICNEVCNTFYLLTKTESWLFLLIVCIRIVLFHFFF